MYDFFEKDDLSLQNHIVFEFISWYGRNFKKNKNKIRVNRLNPLFLDIGYGSNYTNGWVNADFYKLPRYKFLKKKSKVNSPDLELDLRYPINCDDDVFDGIYSGHVIEHLHPSHAKKLLMEIFRILKPNCWLRINFPDLEKFVKFYNGESEIEEFKQFKTGCEAIGSLTQDYGHISVWDSQLMKRTLNEIGFININEVKFGIEGTDKRLIKEEKIREWSSIVIEAQKP